MTYLWYDEVADLTAEMDAAVFTPHGYSGDRPLALRTLDDVGVVGVAYKVRDRVDSSVHVSRLAMVRLASKLRCAPITQAKHSIPGRVSCSDLLGG